MAYLQVDGSFANQGPTGAAISFVTQGWDFFEEKITQLTGRALDLISQMTNLPGVAPTQFHVDFPDLAGLTAFTKPVKPTLPEIAFTAPLIPEPPNLSVPTAPAMLAAPIFDVATPAPIALPAQPAPLTLFDPGPPPELSTLVLPEAPDLASLLPALPEELLITLPELPTLDLPSFAGTDPGAVPALPNLSAVGFTEQPYTPKVLDEMVAAVKRGIAGGNILPAAIEAALFQRGRDRLQAPHKAALQAVDEEFTSRGHKQPPGAWSAARRAERRKLQGDELGLNRDLTIQFHEKAIEGVRFHLERGIALEQLLIGQHSQIMDRALQSARLMLDTHVALYNAQVSGYNAAIERLRVDKDIWLGQLQAAVNQLELYKAQVDGQRAIADINKTRADLYEARVRGIGLFVEQFKAQMEAVGAQADAERTRIMAYGETIKVMAAQVDAKNGEWNAYKTAIEAKQADFKRYEIGVNAYAARVQAWGEGERTKSARFETDIKASGQLLEGWRARMQGVVAQLQVENGRIGALSAQSDAIARMYAAEGTIAAAANDANTRAFEAQANYFDRRAQVQLREAEIKVQDNARIASTMAEAIRGAAQALATLAASAMSAVNFSAGVNGSGSENSSWSYALSKSLGWSWAGETATDPSPPIY